MTLGPKEGATNPCNETFPCRRSGTPNFRSNACRRRSSARNMRSPQRDWQHRQIYVEREIADIFDRHEVCASVALPARAPLHRQRAAVPGATDQRAAHTRKGAGLNRECLCPIQQERAAAAREGRPLVCCGRGRTPSGGEFSGRTCASLSPRRPAATQPRWRQRCGRCRPLAHVWQPSTTVVLGPRLREDDERSAFCLRSSNLLSMALRRRKP